MNKCNVCPIRKGCDILSEFCLLTPREVATERPDLLKPPPPVFVPPKHRPKSKTFGGRAKKSSPERRAYWKELYRRKRAEAAAVS